MWADGAHEPDPEVIKLFSCPTQLRCGEMSTDDRHNIYFSEEEDRHEYGVRFLVYRGMVSPVLGCRPVSSRLISVRQRAAPFNITFIQI